MVKVFALSGLAAALAAGPALAQQVLKNEPPQGGMRSGEVILVDDGKCPKGQIKKVTAGVIVGRGQAGSSGQGTPRERTCVPRS